MRDRIDVEFIFNLIVCVVIIAFLVLIIGGAISSNIENANNRIDAGVIVNRYIDSGYSYASTSKSGGHYANYPTEYYFVIEGEKDGVTVRYKFEVTAEEYEKYRIGDYYER